MQVARLRAILLGIAILVQVVILCLFNAALLRPAVNTVSYSLGRKFYGPYFKEPNVALMALSSLTSPDLFVRSAYLDKRQRYGWRHDNASVFMVEVRKTILDQNLIVGCQVGHHYTSSLKLRPLWFNMLGRFLDEKPGQTHAMVVIECYDLPAKNGSKAYIFYKTNLYGMVIVAESEHPYIVPAPPPKSSAAHPFRILVCTLVFGQPRFLKKWLPYQRSIGVDHVHLIAEDSFQKGGELEEPYLKEAIKEGFVSVDVWEQKLRWSEIHYHSQLLVDQDCLFHFQGTYDYMFLADQDDFFVPLVANQSTLHYYIDNWCYKGACSFHWRHCYLDPDCIPKDGDYNISSWLEPFANFNKERKTLYKLSTLVEAGIHDPVEMLSGSRTVTVPKDIAYVANGKIGNVRVC